jgi:hypothetical protein
MRECEYNYSLTYVKQYPIGTSIHQYELRRKEDAPDQPLRAEPAALATTVQMTYGLDTTHT